MGVVVSTAVAAGPGVLENLETPFNRLKEQKSKRRRGKTRVKVQKERAVRLEREEKQPQVEQVHLSRSVSPDWSRNNTKHRSRPVSRSGSYSPTKRPPSRQKTSQYTQYNPVEKYLVNYIAKHDVPPKETETITDEKQGQTSEKKNEDPSKKQADTEGGAMTAGIPNKFYGTLLGDPPNRIVFIQTDPSHRQKTNDSTHMKNQMEGKVFEVSTDSENIINGSASVMDDRIEHLTVETGKEQDDRRLENKLDESNTHEDNLTEQTNEDSRSSLAKVVDSTLSNIKQQIDNVLQIKPSTTQDSESPQSEANPEETIQRDEKTNHLLQTSLDEQIQSEIQVRYDGLLEEVVSMQGSRVSTATGKRRGKTRKIIVDSYRSLPPERREEFEIYAQNILRQTRNGGRTKSSRSSRVNHPQDWQT